VRSQARAGEGCDLVLVGSAVSKLHEVAWALTNGHLKSGEKE
jgi:hypothetical protein